MQLELVSTARDRMIALSARMSEGLIGLETLVERLVISLLSGGHVLIEGAPGLAKTRAVKLLAAGLDASFARIQCTPDLMPADLTGTSVFRPDRGTFEFVPGPVFHSLVLVDEINRAPPKVQSALLEAMAETQVTVAGITHALPETFMVVATQNPIEHEGTFPLPEAQLDRFLLHVKLDLPGIENERRILDLVEAQGIGAATERIRHTDVLKAREEAMAVHLSPALRDYIVQLVTATRSETMATTIAHAVSPRGTLALAATAKAKAFLAGRDYATPNDVAELAADVLSHRMVLSWRAAADGETGRAIVGRLLKQIEPL